MDKSLRLLLALFLVSGLVFSGCEFELYEDDDYEDDDHEEEEMHEDDEPEAAVESEPAAEPAVVESAPVETTPVESAPAEVAEPLSTYVDGTYSASGDYNSPGGPDTLRVSLTIADDVITGVSVSGEASNNESQVYLDNFIGGIHSVVNGVSLSELNAVGAVNGASLTAGGFNTALASIKSQALR